MAVYKNEIHNQVVVTGEKEILALKAQLEAADSRVQDLNEQLEGTKNQLSAVRAEYASLSHEKGVDILKQELSAFKETAKQSEQELRTFLQSVNLIDQKDLSGYGGFDDLFKKIRSGCMTAGQAILEIKTQHKALLEESFNKAGGVFDAGEAQQIVATLNTLGNTISEVNSRIIEMQQNGVKTSSGGIVDSANIFEQIRASVEGMSDEAKAAYQPITQLVQSLTEYANLDSTSILGVSQALRNIADIGSGSYSTKSIENIIRLIKELQAASATGLGAIRFDLTGMNNLHVSKASMRNLAEYLPTIASVNAARLDRLSKVDLTNFNNVKVSKASMEAIAQLNEALKRLQETKAATAQEGNGSIDVDILSPNDTPKKLSQLSEAKKAIKDYYNALTEARKNVSDLRLSDDGSTWMSDKHPIEIENLNNLRKAYEMYRNDKVMAQMEGSDQYKVLQLENEITTQLAISTERLSEAERKRASNANATAELNAKWQSQGLTESNIKSLFGKAEKNQELFENFEVLRDRYQEVIQLHEEWKRNGRSTDKSITKPIEDATRALKDEIEATLELVAVEKRDESSENRYQTLLKRGYKLLQQLVKEEQNWTTAKHGKSSGAYKNIRNYREELEKLLRDFESGKIAEDDFNRRIQEISKSAQISGQIINANGEATKAWIDRVGGLASKFASWFSLTRVIMAVVRKMKEMISSVIEIDSALGQLRIVTQASTSDLNQYAQSISDVAERTGASITDLIDSTTTYARLGYNLNQSSILAEYTSMLSKVGAVDVKDAQSAVTAITKAFKEVDADDIESVLDKLVKVGNSFPISTAEISEGLNNAASALAASGNTFEKSVALLTAANTTVNLCRAA